jgi:hypothetical protein
MADQDRMTPTVSPESSPEADRGDLTPPHGDELRSEGTFGRTDRYANQDDPDAESPVVEPSAAASQEDLDADARRRRMEQIDDAAADDARMATRKREHSAD